MVGDMSRVTLNFDLPKIPIKNSLCAFLARVKTYTHTKNLTYKYTGSYLRAVTDADDDDDDNAAHQKGDILPIIICGWVVYCTFLRHSA